MPDLATEAHYGSRLDVAGRRLLSDVMGGAAWEDALESLMSELNCLGGALTCVMPPGSLSLTTSAVSEVFNALAMGTTPPLTARTRITPRPDDGFICDQMDPYRTARDKDPFYQEVVRPRGLAYQASAWLDQTEEHVVNLVVYRTKRTHGFQPETLRSMRSCLPYLRAAAMTFRARLQSEADARAASFHARDDTTIHLSHDGVVRDRSIDAVRSLAPDMTLAGRRLALDLSADQRRLDRAVATALLGRRPGLVTVTGKSSQALRFLVLPVTGQAQDLFGTTSVLVVVLSDRPMPKVDEGSLDLLARSTGLTRRETDVTRLVADGNTPRRSADILDVSYATIRQHLKNVYAKLDVHSQGELVALLSRLPTR